MGADASWPLQRAIVQALQAVPRVRACLLDDRSGDRAETEGDPQPAGAACLRIESWLARAWHSATFDGQEHDIRLLLTVDEGEAATRELGAAIVARLHDADLSIPGHALVELAFESSETRYDAASDRHHCRFRFRALTVSD